MVSTAVAFRWRRERSWPILTLSSLRRVVTGACIPKEGIISCSHPPEHRYHRAVHIISLWLDQRSSESTSDEDLHEGPTRGVALAPFNHWPSPLRCMQASLEEVTSDWKTIWSSSWCKPSIIEGFPWLIFCSPAFPLTGEYVPMYKDGANLCLLLRPDGLGAAIRLSNNGR